MCFGWDPKYLRFITQPYPNQVEKAIFLPKVFGTQLFLFLFDFFEEIGYQKTSGEKIASRPD